MEDTLSKLLIVALCLAGLALSKLYPPGLLYLLCFALGLGTAWAIQYRVLIGALREMEREIQRERQSGRNGK